MERVNEEEEREEKMIEDNLPVIRRYSQIKLERLEWIWPNRIPKGKITLVVGNPKVGKSMLVLYIAAQISQGARWPDQPGLQDAPGSVIILTTEDSPSDTIRPRLEAAGADLDKIIEVKAQEYHGNEYEYRPMYDLTRDLPVLEEAVRQIGDVQVVIIDPITAFMGGKNENSNTDVREFAAPLSEMAERYKLAVVGVSHLNKKSDVQAAYRVLGSIGWTATARAIWFVAEDKEEESKKYMLPCGGNLGKKPTGLIYWLVDEEVVSLEGPIESVRCEFEADAIEISPDDVLAGARVLSAKEEAMEWLKDYLRDGPIAAGVVMREVEKEGIKKRTLDRAKKGLGVVSYQIRNGEGMKWVWRLKNETRNG